MLRSSVTLSRIDEAYNFQMKAVFKTIGDVNHNRMTSQNFLKKMWSFVEDLNISQGYVCQLTAGDVDNLGSVEPCHRIDQCLFHFDSWLFQKQIAILPKGSSRTISFLQTNPNKKKVLLTSFSRMLSPRMNETNNQINWIDIQHVVSDVYACLYSCV